MLLRSRMIKAFNVYSYEFDGYWKDVGTVDEYWKANLELIKEDAPIDIYDLDFNIYTKPTIELCKAYRDRLLNSLPNDLG